MQILKHLSLLLAAVLTAVQAIANINHIDLSKISSESKHVAAFNAIKENLQYYDHWVVEWTYAQPKEELIQQLHDNYSTFSSIKAKNTELYLLLGDISHYLYNLEDSIYYHKAIENYTAAAKASPSDFRCYWFAGYHYALSNEPEKALTDLNKAQQLLPKAEPADFWNDFAWASGITNMPSHCIYAMDKVKSISGKEGFFEYQLGETIRKRIEPTDKSKAYKKEDIWTAGGTEKIAFTCRPLGIKVVADSSWALEIYDYEEGQSAFIMNPPRIKNKKGTAINYTIAILMRAAGDKDVLEDYINKMIDGNAEKTRISFSDKYEKMIAYELKDKTMYPEIGGGHLYMIGIERDAPPYPGLLLENPAILPQGDAGQVSYYTPSDSKDRFKGKIFYAIMLDSCEDIHKQSFAVFKTFFDNQLIIE